MTRTRSGLTFTPTGSPRRSHLFLAAALVLGALSVADPAFASSPVEPIEPAGVGAAFATVDLLDSGARLVAGASLNSGRYRLVMQPDGNLVQYGDQSMYELPPRVFWQTRTDGHPGSYVVMQTDGNLVVYSSAGRPLWQSGTAGHPGAYAGLSSYGFFSLYSETFPMNVLPLSTGGGERYDSVLPAGGRMRAPNRLEPLFGYTTPDGVWVPPPFAAMQTDGNFVLYRRVEVPAGPLTPYTRVVEQPYWSTRTDGRRGAYLTMQTDGNLVLYSSAGRPLWNTRTNGHPRSRVVMQRDGNLVVYSPANRVLWQSRTAGFAAPPVVK